MLFFNLLHRKLSDFANKTVDTLFLCELGAYGMDKHHGSKLITIFMSAAKYL